MAVTNGKKHLPVPRGPHSVGYVDVFTPGDTGVLSRIYYPTKQACKDHVDSWPQWADDNYISGLLAFIKAMTHRWPSWAPRGEFEHFDQIRKICQWLPYYRFPSFFRFLNGRVFTPIIPNAEMNRDEKWPVIVFSHGLGCARFTYSQICYDLASYGFIVMAPEHREGSACYSFHIDAEGKRWPIPHRRVEWSEEEYFVRNRQVRERCFEACKTLDLAYLLARQPETVKNLINLDNGEAPNLAMFKDSMDLTKPVMAGHSFGGATTLMALGADPRFKVGLVLDGWLFPIRDNDALPDKVTQPVMFINTESFLNEFNLTKMASFSREAEAEDEAERLCYYIKGSVHQNHIDAPFVMRTLILRKMLGMHSSTDPDKVMSLNNRMMVQFIRKHLDLPPISVIDEEIIKDSDLIFSGFGTGHVKLNPPGRP